MLLNVKALRGRPVAARDGEMGWVADVYFDDERWDLRYLVVDTGKSMPQREVLLARSVLAGNMRRNAVAVELTREQIERAPQADSELPVWRQHELSYAGRAAADPHLRSGAMIIGCRVRALDGPIGHVDDLIVDDAGWRVCALRIALRNWLPGKRVLAEPWAVDSIDWPGNEVRLRMTREALRGLPTVS
jgi:hypothetical protein